MTETTPPLEPPPFAPPPPLAPPPVPPRRVFPTWRQGFVLCLGGLALFVSACFGCFATLNSRGSSSNETITMALLIVALVGAGGCAIGGVFILIRIASALFGSKEKRTTP